MLLEIEDHDLAVRENGDMFAALIAQEAIIGARAGTYRVSMLMASHGNGLAAPHDRMREIVRLLANPDSRERRPSAWPAGSSCTQITSAVGYRMKLFGGL